MKLLLQRYLLEELVAPFIVGVLIILVMLLGDQLYYLVDKLVVKGVGLGTVTKLLLFVLPDMMVTSFPLATMLAVSLAVNRLVREEEWSSMRLGGMSLGAMLVPVHLFGLSAGLLAWVVAENIAPQAKQEFVRLTTRLALEDPTMVVKPQIWFQSPAGDRWFYVHSVDKSTGLMRNLVVYSDLRNDYPTVLVARTAHKADGRFLLQHVVRHLWRPDGTLQRESETAEVELQVSRLLPENIGSSTGSGEMTSSQLKHLIGDLKKQGVKRPDQTGELHRKYAMPVACYILALLCVPLNLLTGRRGNFFGLLVTSVLVIVYFLTHEIGVTLAREGFLRAAPALGPWLQNLIFGALAVWLLRRCR